MHCKDKKSDSIAGEKSHNDISVLMFLTKCLAVSWKITNFAVAKSMSGYRCPV